ncbi:hypothetical protein SAMN05216333_1801, partial [Nitrosomonas oligotropha]
MRTVYSGIYLIALLFVLSACQKYQDAISGNNQIPSPAILPAPIERPVSYIQEIRPIIESKCLSCHSCFDAPCQLKLESSEGLLRGAFRESIYVGARKEA